ncbi:MAG TPA: ABC transporter ATP-binding protein [Armatimonadota bacterium]|nr:ABC transporter ATP-binding protein [Armatimonadota bacterium]
MAAISMHGVSKRFRAYDYGNRWLRRELIELMRGKRNPREWRTVLREINLEISQGETVAVLGCNGSGKSTLLKLMAGILQPTTGRVISRGSTGTLLDIGTGFHEDLTGRENVFVDGAILGLSERYLRAILPEIEGFAELEGFMDTPLRYYSSGMKARLGFAVAMSADPDIFLIDEILAVGDEGFRRKCFARLDELVSRGRTIVIVSHDIDAVRRLCTRGIWLHDGIAKADGPIHEVCDQYLSHYETELPIGG